LQGLDILLAEETRLNVRVADDPLTCVAKGTGKVLDELSLFDTFCVEP
jgi:rod shape-determining protein MreB